MRIIITVIIIIIICLIFILFHFFFNSQCISRPQQLQTTLSRGCIATGSKSVYSSCFSFIFLSFHPSIHSFIQASIHPFFHLLIHSSIFLSHHLLPTFFFASHYLTYPTLLILITLFIPLFLSHFNPQSFHPPVHSFPSLNNLSLFILHSSILHIPNDPL